MDPQAKLVVNPVAIILVKKGSKGDRLLFRYPYKLSKSEVDEALKNDDTLESFGNTTPGASISSNVLNTQLTFSTPNNSVQSVSVDSSSGGSQTTQKKATKTTPLPTKKNPYTSTKSPNDSVFFDEDSETNKVTGPVEVNPKFALGCREMLNELTDDDLANLLAVNTELSEIKFELKVNQLRFVGHPSLINDPNRPPR